MELYIHTIDNAMKFLNDSYGLDFYYSPLNEKIELSIFQNAKMSQYILSPHINFIFSDDLALYWKHILALYWKHIFLHVGKIVAYETVHDCYGGTEGKAVGPSANRTL